jgi:hypothetical protein
MATVIAEIRLAPGEVGYYDDYSRIYLNASRPTAKIYAGMNTVQIRKSIRSGRLRLVSGSLNVAPKVEEKPAVKKETPAKPVKPAQEESVVEIKAEPVVEPIVEETAVEEPVMNEPVAEEIATEEPVAKPKRRRKKQAEAE